MQRKRLVIIDYLSNYLRHFIVNPSLTDSGVPVGGVVGFIKDINKFCGEFKPDVIMVAHDGEGGSMRRKAVVKEYKEGRNPIRLNRSDRNLSEQEEADNRVWQQTRLMEYLNTTPIIQFGFKHVEADDIVAEIATLPMFKEWDIIIVSSDKDYFQLCNDHVVVYRPVQKVFITQYSILDEYHIHPTNFALARAIAGDKSDNLKGVPGIGLPTIAKRFPEFEQEETITFKMLYESCKKSDEKIKAYQSILENAETIETNYRIMQLYVSSLSLKDKEKMQYVFANYRPVFNKMDFLALAVRDGLGMLNLESMFRAFNSMIFNGSPFSA